MASKKKRKAKKHGNPISAMPDLPKSPDLPKGEIKKIKVLKVEAPEPDLHRINLELEVHGAPAPPALVAPETPVELDPAEPEPEEKTGWVAWLRSIW